MTVIVSDSSPLAQVLLMFQRLDTSWNPGNCQNVLANFDFSTFLHFIVRPLRRSDSTKFDYRPV